MWLSFILQFLAIISIGASNINEITVLDVVVPMSRKAASVAISENGYMAIRAHIGVYTVSIYRFDDGEWVFERMVSGVDGDNEFGEVLQFDGDMLVAGGVFPNFFYTYIRETGIWKTKQILSGMFNVDNFINFNVHSDVMVIGNEEANSEAGRIELFIWKGTEWERTDVIDNTVGAAHKFLGRLVATHNKTVYGIALDEATTATRNYLLFKYAIENEKLVLQNQNNLGFEINDMKFHKNWLVLNNRSHVSIFNTVSETIVGTLDVVEHNDLKFGSINSIACTSKYILIGYIEKVANAENFVLLYKFENGNFEREFVFKGQTFVQNGNFYDTVQEFYEIYGGEDSLAINEDMFVFQSNSAFNSNTNEISVRSRTYNLPKPPTQSPTRSPLTQGVTHSPTNRPTERPTRSPTIIPQPDVEEEVNNTNLYIVISLAGVAIIAFAFFMKFYGTKTTRVNTYVEF